MDYVARANDTTWHLRQSGRCEATDLKPNSGHCRTLRHIATDGQPTHVGLPGPDCEHGVVVGKGFHARAALSSLLVSVGSTTAQRRTGLPRDSAMPI